VSKKSEALLREEFVDEIKNKLRVEVLGELKFFKGVFDHLIGFINETTLYFCYR
jgi:hypothetical protein